MGGMSGRRKARASKPFPLPTFKRDLVRQATELAEIVKPKGTLEMSRISAMKKDIDISRLQTAIARYRNAIALQTRLLDDLEAEVQAIRQDASKKKPAKSKKRPTRRETQISRVTTAPANGSAASSPWTG